VPGVLRREFTRAQAPDLVVEDVNKVPCFTPWFTRVPVAVIVPHLFGSTVFREAHPVVALYVVLLESLIPFAYARCRFLVGNAEVMEHVYEEMGRGVDYEEAVGSVL